MKTTFETNRLLFRELRASDAEAMFEMDADPDVAKYLGAKPLTHIDQSREMIESIKRQYLEFGIGRWAVIRKDTNEFVGWAGLKFIAEINNQKNVYDLGYRFLKRHWGNGYGSESAMAFIDFGFNEMKLERISAYVDVNNKASIKILEKCGLQFVNTFIDEGDLCAWYQIENPS